MEMYPLTVPEAASLRSGCGQGRAPCRLRERHPGPQSLAELGSRPNPSPLLSPDGAPRVFV